MEKNNKKKTRNRPSFKSFIRNILYIALGISLGVLHHEYVSHLFENDRSFNYLSDLEREMSFRTEMSFYYSYYKTIVEEDHFAMGLSKLFHDGHVEYPKVVNAFNRFNIVPEVLSGTLYRYFGTWMNASDYIKCHIVYRGDTMSPVKSCVGLMVPIYFYLEIIWWLAGISVGIIFFYATTLSGTILGGLLAVMQYFANHAECTRVQWAPNQRENFAQPLILLQMWLVTLQLKQPYDKKGSLGLQICTFLINCLCLIFWQFTQFIFLTQIAIIFVMEQLRIINLKTFYVYLHTQFCGIDMAVVVMQGNDMLKSSLYMSFFIVVAAYSLLCSSLRLEINKLLDLLKELILIYIKIIAVVYLSLWLKRTISQYFNIEEDSHIYDLLYSKFRDYKTFHTLMYTCSAVFDYLPKSVFVKLTLTGLIPLVIFGIINIVLFWYNSSIDVVKNNETVDQDNKKVGDVVKNLCNSKDLVLVLKNSNVDPAIFYNVSQMFVFGFMAVIIMRLKLLFTPHLCLVAALAMNLKYYDKKLKKYHKTLSVVFTALMAVSVYYARENMKEESSHIGEFSDWNLEHLLTWIKTHTAPEAVFAGPMPIMANVMLSTRRPIVNHPHYEHKDSRERTYAVYKAYGKFSSDELYTELTKLKVTYLVLERNYCYSQSQQNCSFEAVWDHEVPSLKYRPRLCHRLLTEEVEHFYPVFSNLEYTVFRVHDYSVRYLPRIYET